MSVTYMKDKVQDKAKEIRGKGWEIDHIKPSAQGDSDALRNLQALNTSVNRSKGTH